MDVTVYYDYLCPFAYRGMELAEQVAGPLDVAFDWRHFSLYQSNYKGEDGWQLSEDALQMGAEDGGKGLLPFLASHAARDLGDADAFRLELARAHHVDGEPYTLQTILNVAKKVGIDADALEEKLQDPDLRHALAEEHAEAAANHVTGTPTFRFASGDQSYFRMADLPTTQEDAVKLFSTYRTMLTEFPFVQNVKRYYEVRRPG